MCALSGSEENGINTLQLASDTQCNYKPGKNACTAIWELWKETVAGRMRKNTKYEVSLNWW